MWFSAATLGSNQIGKTINLASVPVLNNCEKTQTVSLGFSFGNQTIHNNIVALYYTYKDLGIEGLAQLRKDDPEQSYITPSALNAFELYSVLENQAINYANSQELSPIDLNVIKHVLNQDGNLETLKDASMYLVEHEQKIVAPMYDKVFFDSDKTVGEVLSDVSYIEMLVANGFKLSGATVLDKYISVDGYDFSSFEDRMAYFGKVFDEYFLVLSQEGGLEQLIQQRESIASLLGVDYIEYGKHFVNDHSEDFVFVKYYPMNTWKIISGFKLPDYESAPQFGRVYYNDDVGRMLLPRDYPLQKEIFYYSDDEHRLYSITGNWPMMYPQLLQDGNGSWTLLKRIWVPKEVQNYPEVADNPYILNYTEYLLWVRDEPVNKEVLLSWLGNYIVEDLDFIYPEVQTPAPVPDSFASDIHHYTYVLRSPALVKELDYSSKQVSTIKAEDEAIIQSFNEVEDATDTNTHNSPLILEPFVFANAKVVSEAVMSDPDNFSVLRPNNILGPIQDILQLNDIFLFNQENLQEVNIVSERIIFEENIAVEQDKAQSILSNTNINLSDTLWATISIEGIREIQHPQMAEMG